MAPLLKPLNNSMSTRGQALVELLVAFGLTTLVLSALITSFVSARAGTAQEEQRLLAVQYAREDEEALRSIRENSWLNIATNGTYHSVINGSSWALVAGSQIIDGFLREIVITDAQRNSQGALVGSGGTADPSTKRITIRVSWGENFSQNISNVYYYARYLNNAAVTHTTQADFASGTSTRALVTNNTGGEVQLEGWSAPVIQGTIGVTTGRSLFVSGNRAYVGMNANGGTEFRIYDISNPTAPSLLGQLELGANINGIAVVGNFAYVASANNAAELTVVDVSNPAAPTTSGTTPIDLAGNTDAQSVSLSTTTSRMYLGRRNDGGPEFFIINLANPAAPSVQSSLEIGDHVNSIVGDLGTHVYAATGLDTGELTVVDVSNLALPSIAGSYDAAGNQSGLSVFATTSTAVFLGRQNNAGPEMEILNASNPASIAAIGSFEAGGDINGIFATSSVAFLAASVDNEQLKAVDIYNFASPTLISNTNFGGGGNDAFQLMFRDQHVFSIDNNNFRTTIGNAASGFFSNGTFESGTIDAGSVVDFNIFSWSVATSTNASVKLQIALNSDNATWNFVGPDNTANTFYTVPADVPAALARNRYVRYKVFLNGTAANTPILDYVSINYLPQNSTGFVTIVVTGDSVNKTIDVKATRDGFTRKFQATGTFSGTVFTVNSWKEME